MRALQHPYVRLTLLALWCCAWFGVGALLLLPIRQADIVGSDLVAHALLFFGMAFTALGFCRRVLDLVALSVLTFAGSAALEWAQSLVPHRTFDPLDAIANAVGAGFGCVAAISVLVFVVRPVLADLASEKVQAGPIFFSIGPRGAPPKM